MQNNNHHVGLGLTSLFLSIPTPTIILEAARNLGNEGYFSFLNTTFQGLDAQLLLLLMITANITLFCIAVFTLGKYLTDLLKDTSLIDS